MQSMQILKDLDLGRQCLQINSLVPQGNINHVLTRFVRENTYYRMAYVTRIHSLCHQDYQQ